MPATMHPKMPKRDLRLETLGEVLQGRRTVHHHTHRHDDIMTVLRLAKEFNFKVVLHHVSDGWKVADEIAAAGAPCSIIVIDSPGGKQEAIDLSFRTGKILADAGVQIAYHTDDWITGFSLLPAFARHGHAGRTGPRNGAGQRDHQRCGDAGSGSTHRLA